ncbi:DUF979 domain-containing protein [Sphingosinicella ginsenosidimutans]|uniref:DUF979 domain-containing protein n=1 Tax=Allosphingosinicella ginsenosidimutans TaxID=1176539 RepID=A0A5C6TTZ3_9SPHN|nr:DUF979 domain-containing protein [Sphingosinicella ginsenosidimutans]TXC63893.1 DUF979 domain-containing protein [Sphingosinicella ginsenosidimutans]
MITLQWAYSLAGLMFAAFAVLSALDRSNGKRFGNAAFWGLMALSLIAGGWLGDFANGVLVLGLGGLAGFGALGRSSPPTTKQGERLTLSHQLGSKLFLPALIIPAVALAGTLAWALTPLGASGLIEAKRETYIFLCLGALIAVGVIWLWLKPPPLAPLQEGRRLIDAIGWAAVLPQMLAALGTVFAAAHVGDIVGEGARAAIPEGSLFLTVLVFALGMVAFTMIMGNAFAAFPVMSTAIGVPLLIRVYGGDPAVVGAVGMLAGFCGTLMTPMAANFNIVPAALLELRDRNGVIKAQVGTAIPLLIVNIALIYWVGF